MLKFFLLFWLNINMFMIVVVNFTVWCSYCCICVGVGGWVVGPATRMFAAG